VDINVQDPSSIIVVGSSTCSDHGDDEAVKGRQFGVIISFAAAPETRTLHTS